MSATDQDEHGRPAPPATADEVATIDGYVEFLRATLEWKTAGLTDEQLRARLAPSDLTLGGMLHHLAYVEDYWFGVVLAGRAPAPPWDTVDWAADGDWDWHAAADLDGATIRARWGEAVTRSRAVLAELLTGDDPLAATGRTARGTAVSLRYVLVHLVEEYARHAGHADLIRESIDGLVGE